VIHRREELQGTGSARAVPLDFESRSFKMAKPHAVRVVLRENHLLGK